MRVIAGLICVGIWMAACHPKELKQNTSLGVKYEIFVLSFTDSNSDGKGDLKGVQSKLDYLQELGVNGIWLMPIMPSPSYHKYDVSDYKNIHPDYGTLQDFELLVKGAHERGIKIIIDMVLNHTATTHPWFQSACTNEDSPYRDYYVWDSIQSIRDVISKKETTLDSDNITQWHPVNNDTTGEYYYGFFSSHMPDLNFDNQKVREEFVDIARFWLEDMKVDGFRFDAARHIYPDDRAWANHEFWTWYKNELIKIKPDVYLVGEVYSLNPKEVAYYTSGLPSLFNFRMAQLIIESLNKEENLNLVQEYKHIIESYRSVNPDFVDATILSNHDQNRIMSSLKNNELKSRVAASILLTLPGMPYLYYGEEIGMTGIKPDEQIREPFVWGEPSITTTWTQSIHSVPDSVRSLAEQQKDEKSLFNHYKSLIQYRNSNPVLESGDVKVVSRLPKEMVGWISVTSNDSKLILHNLTKEEISIELNEDISLYKSIDFKTNVGVVLQENLLTLPPYASVILKKN